MKPKQYIHKLAGIWGLSYQDVLSHGNFQEEVAEKYAKDMEKGDKFPVGYFHENGMQEGRHRAYAAMLLGCKLIPMVEIWKIDWDYGRNFVEKNKDISREQLDTMFKEKGYDGITDLDWRTFSNYVKYKL